MPSSPTTSNHARNRAPLSHKRTINTKERKSSLDQLIAYIRRGWKPMDCARHIERTQGTCRWTLLGDYEEEKAFAKGVRKPTHNLFKKARDELTQARLASYV